MEYSRIQIRLVEIDSTDNERTISKNCRCTRTEDEWISIAFISGHASNDSTQVKIDRHSKLSDCLLLKGKSIQTKHVIFVQRPYGKEEQPSD